MIDNFALGLSHGLMLLAAWRLLAPPRSRRRCGAADEARRPVRRRQSGGKDAAKDA